MSTNHNTHTKFGASLPKIGDVKNKLWKEKGLVNTALNLLQLTNLSLDIDFKQHAGLIIATEGLKVVYTPEGYVQILIALEYLLVSAKEIAEVGPPEHSARNRHSHI